MTTEQERSVRNLLNRIQAFGIHEHGIMVSYERKYVLTAFPEDGNIIRFDAVPSPHLATVRQILEKAGAEIKDYPVDDLFSAQTTYDTAKHFVIPRLKGYIPL